MIPSLCVSLCVLWFRGDGVRGSETRLIVGYRFLRFLDVEGKEIPGMVVMVHVKKIY